ncbi:hypothetical protein Ngar_c09110 [Candidatus Nitrososphaera gargensis Ga9.2]|uniref:Uncharacterized protein n=1 Tax=Nitrososphaera gargensis (strain Ga9.2) TaxID=1237085 RepID=K0IGA5_NITGG|nr:hypothetical protein Ngar_c09110 [Candidatus Nitrososphaera gargensis Ga9.2]
MNFFSHSWHRLVAPSALAVVYMNIASGIFLPGVAHAFVYKPMFLLQLVVRPPYSSVYTHRQTDRESRAIADAAPQTTSTKGCCTGTSKTVIPPPLPHGCMLSSAVPFQKSPPSPPWLEPAFSGLSS